MTFQHTKLGIAAGWVLAITILGLGLGIHGTVPVLWASAAALIPAGLGFLLWQQPGRTMAQIIHDADVAP